MESSSNRTSPLLTDKVNQINVSGNIRVGESNGYRPEDFSFRPDKESLSLDSNAFAQVFGEDTARVADKLWMNRNPSQADLNEFETRTGMGWDMFMEMTAKTSNKKPLLVVDIKRT